MGPAGSFRVTVECAAQWPSAPGGADSEPGAGPVSLSDTEDAGTAGPGPLSDFEFHASGGSPAPV